MELSAVDSNVEHPGALYKSGYLSASGLLNSVLGPCTYSSSNTNLPSSGLLLLLWVTQPRRTPASTPCPWICLGRWNFWISAHWFLNLSNILAAVGDAPMGTGSVYCVCPQGLGMCKIWHPQVGISLEFRKPFPNGETVLTEQG